MEKIWLNSYEQGVPAEIDPAQYRSIIEIFEQSVQKYGAQPAFHSMGTEISYQKLAQLAEQFASYLQNQLQLRKGDRIALMMPNVLQYPVALFGALKAGLIIVNTNPLYTPRELEHQLNDSGANTIVILENFANTLELVLPKTRIKHVIVAKIGDLFGCLKGMLLNFAVKHLKKAVPNYRIPHAIAFTEALRQGAKLPFQTVDLSPDDLALLQYTGGTTGIAKGAMLSHSNICANMLQADEWIKNKLSEQSETVIAALPLYHIFAFTINLMIFVRIGAKVVLIANPRDIGGFIKELGQHPISVFMGVNTLFNALLNHPEFAKLNFSTWKITVGGGMATQQSIAERWFKTTKQPIIDAYGLTEASPGVCANPLNIAKYTGKIGLPLPSVDVSLRDAQGREVNIGEAGELWIKGPQVMQGYWQRPDETAKVIDEKGFLETGDIAVMDESGWLKLVDRKKDLIVVSGFNVYPNEIEEVVAQHPKVLEVACVGVHSEQTGEALKLFVVKKDESLNKDELIAYCRTQLTAYKVPRNIEFRDELPKSNVGKILRRQLRQNH